MISEANYKGKRVMIKSLNIEGVIEGVINKHNGRGQRTAKFSIKRPDGCVIAYDPYEVEILKD